MRHADSKAKKRKQKNKGTLTFAVLLLIIAAAVSAFLLIPKSTTSPNSDEPAGLRTLAAQYMQLMESLNSTETKGSMRAQLNPSYNQTDLFMWEHSKLTFASDPAGFFEDPMQILSSGKGICVQWSIVYVSACLALGYQSRLVAAVDTSSWSWIHMWAEDYVNGTWVHVDPSDGVWNNPSRYQTWAWGSELGSTVRVYAFEDGSFQDVTATYC